MGADSEAPPRKLSSSQTFFYKRIFPLVWFGGVGLFAVTALFNVFGGRMPVFFLVVSGLMAAAGYVIMKLTIWNAVDEVWDGGDLLVVCNRGEKEAVALADVVNVSSTTWQNPEQCTLTLRQPTRFGTDVTFLLPKRLFPFGKHPLVRELIARADEARRNSAA